MRGHLRRRLDALVWEALAALAIVAVVALMFVRPVHATAGGPATPPVHRHPVEVAASADGTWPDDGAGGEGDARP